MMQRESRRIFLSPSLHHVRYREKTFPLENKSISPCRTSSYTSLNSFLKERHLSLDDYLQLRKALRTLLDFASNSSINENERVQQRLTSPYLQSRSNNHDQSSLPLYTDEHFIRNGLLNHNEGPDIDEQCVSTFFGSSPLPLRSTKNHFLSAMTSNFTNDRTTNASSFADETDSIFVRRQKVQSWQQENRFQRSKSTEKQVESQTDGKMIFHTNGSLDQIFPMMKVLGKKKRKEMIVSLLIHIIYLFSQLRSSSFGTFHRNPRSFLRSKRQKLIKIQH